MLIHVSKLINERKTESTCIISNSYFKSKLNSFSLIVLYLYGSCLKIKTPIFMFKFRVYSQKLSVYLQKLALYRDNSIKKYYIILIHVAKLINPRKADKIYIEF